MTPIRIILADDHPIVRDGLSAVLLTQPDFTIAGEAGNGMEVIQLIEEIAADVLMLDLEMPEMDGVATLRELRARDLSVRTIVFTAFDTDDRIVEAVRAGAQGYLLKGAPREELFNAIRVVHSGGTLLQPIIASRLMRRLNEPEPDPLSAREQEVLALLAQGMSNRGIADALIITERTVKFHVSAIMGKLGANNRTEAVAIAVERGLIDR